MAPQQFECTFLIVYKSELHFQRKTVKDMPHMKNFLVTMGEFILFFLYAYVKSCKNGFIINGDTSR